MKKPIKSLNYCDLVTTLGQVVESTKFNTGIIDYPNCNLELVKMTPTFNTLGSVPQPKKREVSQCNLNLVWSKRSWNGIAGALDFCQRSNRNSNQLVFAVGNSLGSNSPATEIMPFFLVVYQFGSTLRCKYLQGDQYLKARNLPDTRITTESIIDLT